LALGATIHQFSVQLSHVDRGIYDSIELRVARHPSESEEFMWARVLAFCLERQEGLAFSKGLEDPDQPALEVRDLTGGLRAWIEVGTPDAARLHRAAKAAPRVAVYTHTDADATGARSPARGFTAASRSSCTGSTARWWRRWCSGSSGGWPSS
jgi:uncharacterized protein YaeQ